MKNQLSCLLYTSLIAPECRLTSVAQIVKQARELNAIRGITGVLVFDGERFSQYVEGPCEAINSLAQKLSADPRHEQFSIRAEDPEVGSRRFRTWSMGFVDVDFDDIDILSLSKLSGVEALNYFEQSVVEMDVQ